MPRQKTSTQIKRAYQSLKRIRLPLASKRRRKLNRQELINLESEVGRVIFGDAGVRVRREFFYHGSNLWMFFEDFPGREPMTITYEVRDTEILKILPDRSSVAIEGDELFNFLAAARTYAVLVKKYIYGEETEDARV